MQFQLTKEYLNELRQAIRDKNESFIVEKLHELYPADIAEIFDELDLEEAQYLYRHLEKEEAAEVLMQMEEEARERFLSALSSEQIARTFIDNLDSDDAADLISELPEIKKEEVISHIEDADQASDIVDLLTYDEDTAGGLMAKELIKVNVNWSVFKCITEVRAQAEEVENVYTVYVVDDNDKLVGILPLKKLLLVPTKTKVKEIYNPDVISAQANLKDEEVAKIMEKYDLVVLPVVDEQGRLLGRITIDDVVDVIKEEADKDYQLLSGISENVESSDSIWIITRARLPWLLIALLGGIVGSQIISIYEPQIQIHPEMAFFMPLIAAMGGNVGVQSSALIVQGLANNSIDTKEIIPKLWKEVSIGLINGLTCSIALLAYNLAFNHSIALSLTVSVALITVILFAALFGTFVPLALNRYKIDPALATGPFITTTNDIIGLFIYFMIGRLMYGII
jgi:magnesium transporter